MIFRRILGPGGLGLIVFLLACSGARIIGPQIEKFEDGDFSIIIGGEDSPAPSYDWTLKGDDGEVLRALRLTVEGDDPNSLDPSENGIQMSVVAIDPSVGFEGPAFQLEEPEGGRWIEQGENLDGGTRYKVTIELMDGSTAWRRFFVNP